MIRAHCRDDVELAQFSKHIESTLIDLESTIAITFNDLHRHPAVWNEASLLFFGGVHQRAKSRSKQQRSFHNLS